MDTCPKKVEICYDLKVVWSDEKDAPTLKVQLPKCVRLLKAWNITRSRGIELDLGLMNLDICLLEDKPKISSC